MLFYQGLICYFDNYWVIELDNWGKYIVIGNAELKPHINYLYTERSLLDNGGWVCRHSQRWR